MKKFLTLFLSFIIFFPAVSGKGGSRYLVSGHNTLHRIKYSCSSSFTPTFEGNKAMDSDRATTWLSKKIKGPHWLTIDFGTKRIMTKIIVFPGKKDNYPTLKKIALQFKYKGKWFDFAARDIDTSLFGGGYGPVSFNLDGIDASTFRLYVPDGATRNGHAAIAEVEIYIGSSKIAFFDARLKGLGMPIERGFLPTKDYFYPGAPRRYRGGKHKGLDIYRCYKKGSYDPQPVTKKTPVLAARDGVIIRADLDYKGMTPQQWKNQSDYYRRNPRTFVKRSFGGIQVWIDHLDGVVTTYNHLNKIKPGIKNGTKVKKGEVIGWAGNSGLYSEAVGDDSNVHLHFEIWVDGFYLGYGMPVDEIKRYFVWIFYDMQ